MPRLHVDVVVAIDCGFTDFDPLVFGREQVVIVHAVHVLLGDSYVTASTRVLVFDHGGLALAIGIDDEKLVVLVASLGR